MRDEEASWRRRGRRGSERSGVAMRPEGEREMLWIVGVRRWVWRNVNVGEEGCGVWEGEGEGEEE